MSGFDDIHVDDLRRRRTAKWTEFGPDILPAGTAEMDFPIAEPIRQALLDCIERGEFGYAVRDTGELAQVCGRFFERAYQWSVPVERVCFVPDVLDGVMAALEIISAPGSSVVVPTPAFPPLLEVIEVVGRRVCQVPMVSRGGRWFLNLTGIELALGQDADTVLLCNPHNPTGRVFTPGELSALAEVVERHSARVVADEVHAPLTFPPHTHLPYAALSSSTAMQAITLMSASKGWNIAGLKCAQLILTNADDLRRWRARSPFAVGGVTPIAIAATYAAYRYGASWHRVMLDYLDGNRRLVTTFLADLPGIRCNFPEGTYFSWINCSDLGVPEPARFFREQAGVGLGNGADYGAGGEGYVRLNFAASRTLLERMVRSMAKAIQLGRQS
jgi:cystathionine beta-lyase